MLLRFGCFVMVTMIWIDVGGSTLCLLNLLKDPSCCSYNSDEGFAQQAFILGKLLPLR